MVKPLLDDIEQSVAKVGGDGAYDQVKVYEQLKIRHIQPLIPPRVNAVIWIDQASNDLAHPRRQIEAVGLTAWKRQCGYHRRRKAETAMFRWKACFGERLATRLLTHQQTEAQVKAACLNQFTKLGMPKAVKCQLT